MTGVARFRNTKVRQLWGAVALWDLAVMALGWFVVTEWTSLLLVVRIGLLAVFIGTAGLLTGLALASATLTVDVLDDRAIVVARRWPLRTVIRRVEPSEVPPALVIDETDHDGDVSYTCRVMLADGTALDLAEGAIRSAVGAEAARFNAATGRPPN